MAHTVCQPIFFRLLLQRPFKFSIESLWFGTVANYRYSLGAKVKIAFFCTLQVLQPQTLAALVIARSNYTTRVLARTHTRTCTCALLLGNS